MKFTVTPEHLKFYNSNLEYNWELGEFELQIGGNSRDVKKAKVIGKNKIDRKLKIMYKVNQNPG